MSNNEEKDEWEALGEMKLSELSEEEVEVVLMLMYEELEAINEQIAHYQALERLQEKKKKQGKHFSYQCRPRSKYLRGDIRNHADEKRTGSKDLPS
jgi:hypothetical protein